MYDETELMLVEEESGSEFFAPTPTDALEPLIGSYEFHLKRIAEVSAFMASEPSAGLGAIADLVPKQQLCCVEIAPLHCTVLRAKGHAVECADFLQWSDARVQRGAAQSFERIVMNPPYSEGRWRLHLEAAAALLCPGGVLAAVLPASAKSPRGEFPLAGGALEWSEVFRDQFPGASVDVVVLKFTKAGAAATAPSAAAGVA